MRGLREVRGMRMRVVVFKAPEAMIEFLDWLVESGRYMSKGEAIRAAISDLMKKERRIA